MASIGSTAHITGDDNTTEGRARRLYAEVLADVHSKGIKSRSVATMGIGYLWNGNLQQLAAKCWPGLTIEPGRTGPASKQFLEVIKKYLRDTKNVVWVQDRGQYYVSPEYKEARVKKAAKAPVVTPDLAQESILERSRRIWIRAQAYCEQGNVPVEVYKGVEFFVCDKPLAFFVKAEFPELCMPAMQTEVAFEKYRRPFYDLLRATTNAVNVGSKHFETMTDGEHKWLIRKEWHDSNQAFSQVFDFPEDDTVKPTAGLYSVQPLLLVIGSEVRRKSTADGDKVTAWKVVQLPKDGPVVLEGISGPGKGKRLPVSTEELAREWEVIVRSTPAPPAPKPPKVKPEAKTPEPKVEPKAEVKPELKVEITPKQALDVLENLSQVFIDVSTEKEMLESECERLAAEVERLRTENESLQASIEEAHNSSTVIELVEEVLSNIYSGTIGMGRAIADVEDIVRTAKSSDGS